MFLKILVTTLTLIFTQLCWAERPLNSASAEEIVNRLTQSSPNSLGMSRNLFPEAVNNSRPTEKPQIDLVVNFDFDSARILPNSKPILNNLAKAMNMPALKANSFTVEGHTDAVGAPGYNLQLSNRRAAAVIFYLQEMGVGDIRLTAVGKGSTELLLPSNPEAAENRRVRIRVNP